MSARGAVASLLDLSEHYHDFSIEVTIKASLLPNFGEFYKYGTCMNEDKKRSK